MKSIVILGGSYAGVSTAHRLLQQASKIQPFKVTIVSPNTHFYWSLASPRGFLPGQLSDDELFQSIAAGFEKYSADRFEFVLGLAESVDVDTKAVQISSGKVLNYDYLVLATGSRSNGNMPFKGLGSTQATKDALHQIQTRIQKAKTIVVAGAGVTGVEVAGELAFEYGRHKKIVLIASGREVLEGTPTTVPGLITKELKNLGVDIKLQTKVTGSVKLPNGQQELTLSSGEKCAVDMYIPTFGLIPNSSYLPPHVLDSSGYVLVDEYLKLNGADNVWAIGDVTNVEPSQFIYCDRQSCYLTKSIVSTLSNKKHLPYNQAAKRFLGIQVGRNFGTGHYGNFKLPSFMITFARKSLFVEFRSPLVSGSLFSGLSSFTLLSTLDPS